MKIKILLVPILLLLIVYLLVWVAAPQFSALKNSYNLLKAEKNKLQELKNKAENVNSLVADLSDNTEKQKVILAYLPEDEAAEEIINDLNAIANSSGVLISGIAISPSEQKSEPAQQTMSSAKNELLRGEEDIFGGMGMGVEMQVDNIPNISDVSVDFQITGSYANVKSSLEKLSKLKRYNKIGSVNITKSESGLLETSIASNFSYLNKVDGIYSLNNSIFSQTRFNTSVIEKIKEKLTTGIAELSAGTAGKSDPFAP